MKRRGAFAILLLLAWALVGCGAREDPRFSMTFAVKDLPVEPSAAPETEPAPSPPPEPAPLPPPEPPPDPSALAAQRIRRLNERLLPVHFDTSRWEITADGLAAIEANAGVLRSVGPFTATIEGHADERGSEAYNHVLGIWRAKAVKDRLRSLGFDPSWFTILSHGQSRPAVPGSDPDALAKNRRVEIVVRSAS